MKIIGVDNYDRENVADMLVCENVANKYVGKIMVEALNETGGTRFFKLVDDSHRLWRGMEEFV